MVGTSTPQVKHKRREMIHAELKRWKEAGIEADRLERSGIDNPEARREFAKQRQNEPASWLRAESYIDVELGI